MPTFRREHTINRAISSIRAQDHEGWELIVIDNDGRSGYAFDDERIRCVTYTAKRGASYARNFGITLAEKELICFFDDDDRMLRGYLSAFNHAFSDPMVKMARCQMASNLGTVVSLATPQVVMRTMYATPTWIPHTRHDQIYYTEIMDRNKWTFVSPEFRYIQKILCQAMRNDKGGLRDEEGHL